MKDNAGWIPFRSQTSGWPILAQCAYEMKTNYIRILLAHGADINHAIKPLEKVNAEDAVKLLRAIAAAETHRNR